MQFDIFFSIAQTPVEQVLPSETTMLQHFFEQVQAADALGFQTAWLAESHLSTQVQKAHPNPVVPHWQGEIGINVDSLQLAHHIYGRTKNIHVGTAILNILCMGGPIAHAERVAAFAALHGLNLKEKRRLHLGFAAGRFDFINHASGIVPRNAVEEAAGPVFKHKVFCQASETFLRLLQGQTLASTDLAAQSFQRRDFRSDAQWSSVQQAATCNHDIIAMEPFWRFKTLKLIPAHWRRELVDLYIGCHQAELQDQVNTIMPTKVLNLSITPSTTIEATHQRLEHTFHHDGGAWQRQYMPQTTLVFVDQDPKRARQAAEKALHTYWQAIEGTIDREKIATATDNALVGTPEQVIEQIKERFHPQSRLMLWFDFFNHDCAAVIKSMTLFQQHVIPHLQTEKA